ncbi:hypothetical protein M3Y97_00237900 [Aphelenchoides bicaudatus]|nr:hypothetical protein M3Y97_00237900 [Aphelenchoides bicaudatus]
MPPHLGRTSWRQSSYFKLIYISIAFIPLAMSQKEAGGEAALAANMKKFQEVYHIATQLMQIGGNILNNSPSGSASPSAQFSRDSGGNGIFGEVRPQLRSVSNYDMSNGFDRYDKYTPSSYGNSEYGGGLLGSGSRSQPRSIMDTLLGSFLGSSLSGPSGSSGSSSTSSIFQPNFDEYGGKQSRYGSTKQGSNIEAIVDALSKSGVKRAVPEDTGGLNAGSFLTQFFSGGRR